jgi:putative tricarboxylic transport membrane protein
MRRANIIIAILLLGFVAFYAYLIAHLPARDLPNTLGAAFMPWVLAGMLALLSILLLVSSLMNKDDDSKVSLPSRDLIGISGLLVLIALYVNLMNYLGFVVVSIFFLGILTWIAGSRKPAEIAIFSITTTIAVYLLFYKFFNVQLPAGILI